MRYDGCATRQSSLVTRYYAMICSLVDFATLSLLSYCGEEKTYDVYECRSIHLATDSRLLITAASIMAYICAKCQLTSASKVRRYMDCVSKSSGPNRKTVPSVVSGVETFCRMANCGGPHNSRSTAVLNSGFFLAIT